MGTINYYTSDYITLGIYPYCIVDFEEDKEFMKEMQNMAEEYDTNIDDEIEQYIADLYNADIGNVKYELEKHRFKYFNVSIELGYYEGFSLNIENDFGIYFNDYEKKREVQKEITELKQFLIDCAGLGMVACYPSWCTGYQDYKGTIKEIHRAIREMRESVRNTPTWRKYKKRTK